MEAKLKSEVYLTPRHSAEPFFALDLSGLQCSIFLMKSDTHGRAEFRRALTQALTDLDALEDPISDPPEFQPEADGPILPYYPGDCGCD